MQDGLGAVQAVLVVGASSDIAGATLRRLVEQRTRRVVLAGRHGEHLDELAADLRSLGATTVERVEIRDPAPDTEGAFVERVFTRLPDTDLDLVLVDSDALADQGRPVGTTSDPPDVATGNSPATASLLWAVARRLREQGHGVLVVLSPGGVQGTTRLHRGSGSSPADLESLLRSLRESLVGSGVSLLIVRSVLVGGSVAPEAPPTARAVTPEAVADAVVEGIAGRRRVVRDPWRTRSLASVLAPALRARQLR